MRRLLTGLVVAATTVLAPMFVWAGNQETAEEIAKGLRASGQLHNYRIGIKYQDGTVWLRGDVANPEQLQTALALTAQMPGVTRVVNNLSVAAVAAEAANAAAPAAKPAGPTVESKPQPAGTAFQPEQARRLRSGSFGAIRSMVANKPAQVAPEQASPPPQPAQPSLAERLAATFLSAPAKPVTVEEPVAPPQQAAGPQVTQPLTVAMQPERSAQRLIQPIPAAYLQPQGPAAPAEIMPPATAAPAQIAAPTAPVPATVPQPQYQSTPVQQYQQAPVMGQVQQAVPGVAPYAVPGMTNGTPLPCYMAPGVAPAPARYDNPALPGYAWPSYASYPNYAAVTYPRQYSPTAWPYIGPFYPYPQVPLGWRKVCLEWDDGWWMLDFKDRHHH